MTRRARHPLDKSIIKAIARLMHLHYQTHPNRLAERFEVTPFYIRKIYTEHLLDSQASLRDALKVFIQEPTGTLTAACQQTEVAP